MTSIGASRNGRIVSRSRGRQGAELTSRRKDLYTKFARPAPARAVVCRKPRHPESPGRYDGALQISSHRLLLLRVRVLVVLGRIAAEVHPASSAVGHVDVVRMPSGMMMVAPVGVGRGG
jgi:hypothetical protein